MAEEIQAMDTSAQISSPVSDQSNESNPVGNDPTEKMIPQSQVSKIAAREAREAAEKARKQALEEFQSRANEQVNQQASSIGGMPQFSQDQIRQMIQEEAYKLSQQAVISKIAQDFESKIEIAKQADPEFAAKYEALQMTNHPKTIIWANSLENTTDVIKDMADHPAKYANILMLANNGLDILAQQELQKLSASIKANKSAQEAPIANEPLSQIKTSNIGIDNGLSSVSDFMKQPWLRG